MQQGAKGTHSGLDEFKHGFPTDGLAVVPYEWWKSSSSENNKDTSRKGGSEDLQVDRKKTEELVDDAANILLDDGANPGSGKDESSNNPQGTGLLLQVREKAAEDGRKALRLGVYPGNGANILSRREKYLVHRIFNSSLPGHWRYGSS